MNHRRRGKTLAEAGMTVVIGVSLNVGFGLTFLLDVLCTSLFHLPSLSWWGFGLVGFFLTYEVGQSIVRKRK